MSVRPSVLYLLSLTEVRDESLLLETVFFGAWIWVL